MSRILKFSLKAGILSGVIYYTKKTGVWDESTKSNEFLVNTVNLVNPYFYNIRDQLPPQIKNLPSRDEIYTSVTGCWNHGVITSIAFIRSVPNCTLEYSKRGISFIKKQFNQEHTNPEVLKQNEDS